jgi:hypothetical protein
MMSGLRKKNLWVYGRQTSTLLVAGDVDTDGNLETNVTGTSPYYGEAGAVATVTDFARIGDMEALGIKGIDEGAELKGEVGDRKLLADGNNPVISEKIAAAFKSFDLDTMAWQGGATTGAFGAMPLRKRLATIETGKNVDLCFVESELDTFTAGDVIRVYYVHNVPFHVAFELIANALSSLPCSVEKEVGLLTDSIYVYTCTHA